MKTLFIILIALLLLTAVLICYSALVVASRADEQQEEFIRRYVEETRLAENLKTGVIDASKIKVGRR